MRLHFRQPRAQGSNWIGLRLLTEVTLVNNSLHRLDELRAGSPTAARFRRTNLVINACCCPLADLIAERIRDRAPDFPIVRCHLRMPGHGLRWHVQGRLTLVKHSVREKAADVSTKPSILRHRFQRQTLTR